MTGTSVLKSESASGGGSATLLKPDSELDQMLCAWRCAVTSGATLLGYRAWMSEHVQSLASPAPAGTVAARATISD